MILSMGKKRQVHNKAPSHLDRRNLVVLLLGLIVVLLILVFNQASPSLSDEQDQIANKLIAKKDNELALIVDSKVNSDKLRMFTSLSYDELKGKLGVEKDFVVYFVDENGSVLDIGGKPCFGSPKAIVAGKSCG
jgi:hypothetical protein